jgi:hypothetical protein
LDLAEASKITATGPAGRLLKGDVLAYLGAIDKAYPRQQSARLEKLSHLDLTNINRTTARQPEATPAAKQEEKAETPVEDTTTELGVTISFSAVKELQQRVHKQLGVDIPLDTFIGRAIAVSNVDLPPRTVPPTADELFNQVLGLNQTPSFSSGTFDPLIINTPLTRTPKVPQPDIIDILSGKAPAKRSVKLPSSSYLQPTNDSAWVGLMVEKAEEKRAKVFLERMKTVLQVNPGSLVL